MNDSEVLKTIAVFASPMLLAAIGFFLRGMVKKYVESAEKSQETIQKFAISNALMEKDIKNLTDDLKTLVGEFKNLRETREDVVILKRDMKTMWSRIDEIRAEMRRENPR